MRRVGLPGRALGTICTLLALAGCGFDPEGDQPMDPPPIYREWWAKTEACSGLRGDFGRIQWWRVEGNHFPCSSGKCVGHWESSHDIWLAEDWMHDEMVVRHEMLHDLISRSGHPDPPFGAGCALTWETWNQKEVRID